MEGRTARVLEFFSNTLAFITQIIEGQQLLGDHINARVKGFGNFQSALSLKLSLRRSAASINLKMTRRTVIQPKTAKF